ncbi:MAG: class I tRNA ligase family protein [Polyangiales bacterium]
MSSPLFKPVDTALRFPESERAIAELWRAHRVFEASMEKPAPNGDFVFFEGPPTANGTPHNGHVLTRVMKDLWPRYKTMRGFRVLRKAGWDTHGLPVEVEVEKELRIHGKAAIEEYGVEPFVRKCIDSVFRYTTDWERNTERLAYWTDLPNAYVTYHRSYVESVWWTLKQLYEKGLLYLGHKVVWWWAQGGTALSSAEVGQGYKTVDDPSAFVRFPLRDLPVGAPNGLALAAWTTTPWTLPSNMYAAVKGNATYVVVELSTGPVLIAEPLAKGFAEKTKGTVVEGWSVKGTELDGLRYTPPFELYSAAHGDERARTGAAKYWRVIVEDFVTLDSGTGTVHVAPAFGEDDHAAFKRYAARLGEDLELFCAVKSDGTFDGTLGTYSGRWVKDCDKDILRELKERGVLLHQELYRHDYPFCWRADEDPLIQYARPAWFIRTAQNKEKAIENNRAVDWMPEHIKEGRFGDFLANNVDWALSRERFWGTPLNVWRAVDDENDLYVPESVDEILRLNPHAFDHFHAACEKDPTLNEHLMVHKPWIDQVTFTSPKTGKKMVRAPEVIDCWFDTGCVPFAQWGFPHAPGSLEKLQKQWPADFISEAIDQTRGWFYSLLMVSTLVFDDATRAQYSLDQTSKAHPYKRCIVLGHVGDKEGKKESKSKGNYTPPEVILDRVRMEFAVVDNKALKTPLAVVADHIAWIAFEDLEGLDLKDDGVIEVYRSDRENEPLQLKVKGTKHLPRRVVVLSSATREKLGLCAYPKGLDVKPVEVPRLPASERVFLEDPSTPAPGADAFRWFFYASSPPWTNTRHSLSNVRAVQKDFAIKLRNVFSFFTIYAGIDGFDPRKHARREFKELPSTLDRWILSELWSTNLEVVARMDAFQSYEATIALVRFVESLSNWYVRRSRDRYWASGTCDDVADKRDAYGSLYEVLTTVAGMVAPFTPYLAEEMYQRLVRDVRGATVPVSVHLIDFPTAKEAPDRALIATMEDVRNVVSLGLQVRTSSKLKVRQPLAVATIVATTEVAAGLRASVEVVREELNVHAVELVAPEEADRFVTFKLKPNFRTLGARIGKHVQAVKAALEKANAGAMRAALVNEGKALVEGVEIEGAQLWVTSDEVEVVVTAREGFAAAGDRVGVVVLDTRVTPQLHAEMLARELQNRLQAMRKEIGLAYADRIEVAVVAGATFLAEVAPFASTLKEETLAVRFELGDVEIAACEVREVEVEGERVVLRMRRA